MDWLKRIPDWLLYKDAGLKWPMWIYWTRSGHLLTVGFAVAILGFLAILVSRSTGNEKSVLLAICAAYFSVIMALVLVDRRVTGTKNAVVFFALVAPIISGIGLAAISLGLGIASKMVPDHRAIANIPERNTRVEVELNVSSPLGKSEYDRRLLVRDDGRSLDIALRQDWGGADHVALYFDGMRCLAVIEVSDSHRVDLATLESPGECDRYELPDLLNTDQFLGIFMLFSTYPDGRRRQHFDFVPSDLYAECLETRMSRLTDEESAPLGRYQRACPTFQPDTWPPKSR
ncbi:MAG: hypothetical protein AAGA88_02065 [Pseudomonadota bacterium]